MRVAYACVRDKERDQRPRNNRGGLHFLNWIWYDHDRHDQIDWSAWPYERLRAKAAGVPALVAVLGLDRQPTKQQVVAATRPAKPAPPPVRSEPAPEPAPDPSLAGSLWVEALPLLDLTGAQQEILVLGPPVVRGELAYAAVVLKPARQGYDVGLMRIDLRSGGRQVLSRCPFDDIAAEIGKSWRNLGPAFHSQRGWMSGDHYMLATSAASYLFSTDGKIARKLTADDKWPAAHVQAFAVLGEHLYAAVGIPGKDGYLLKMDLRDGQTQTLVSSRRSERLTPFDDQPALIVRFMVPDPPRNRIVFHAYSHEWRAERCGLWEYVPAANAYRFLMQTECGPDAWGNGPEVSSTPVYDDAFGFKVQWLYRYDLRADKGEQPGFHEYHKALPLRSDVQQITHQWFQRHGYNSPGADRTLKTRVSPLPVLLDCVSEGSYPAYRLDVPGHPEWVLIGDHRGLWRLTIEPVPPK
jgi:hypothetical protein